MTFTWGESGDTHSGLASYRLLVSTDATFADTAADTTLSAGDLVETIDLAGVNDTVYWRVIALDDVGNTRTAGDSRLVRDTFVEKVTLVSPAAGHETRATTPGATRC